MKAIESIKKLASIILIMKAVIAGFEAFYEAYDVPAKTSKDESK